MRESLRPLDVVDYPLGGALDFMRELAAVSHALEQKSSRMKRTLGVTAQQRVALRIVGKYPGITAGQLARLLHVDAGTLSATIRRLEQRQLLRRDRDGRDRRRVTLGLTAKGRDLIVPTAGTVERALETVLSATSSDDLRAVKAFFGRLVDALAANAS